MESSLKFWHTNLSAKPGDYPTLNVPFDFDVNGMLRAQAVDQVSGSKESISVQAIQARLTPQEIARAREEWAEFDFFEDSEEI